MLRISVRGKSKSRNLFRDLKFQKKVVYRMGSTTPLNEITQRRNIIEINPIDACITSSNKILMKELFNQFEVITAKYIVPQSEEEIINFIEENGTVIAKHKHSSRGRGLHLYKSVEDYNNNPLRNYRDYVFEKYHTYTREYRLHCTQDECFHASRKVLVENAQDRWHRHASNSTYIKEDNPMFNKPDNWGDIVNEACKAIKSVGLHIGAVDVKVARNGNFIILETNSCPALGEGTLQKYKTQITKIVKCLDF